MDEEYYISAIAIPLFYKNKIDVRGVFCITSNIENRFGIEDKIKGKKELKTMEQISKIKQYGIKQIAESFETLLNSVSKLDNKEII